MQYMNSHDCWEFLSYFLRMTSVKCYILARLISNAGKFPACMIDKNSANACNNTKWLPSDDLLTEILHIFP